MNFRIITFSAFLLLVFCSSGFSQPAAPLLAPWGSEWAGPGYAARVSSYDRTGGNADAARIGAGETVTLAEIDGPGIIRHIWTTTNAPDTSTRTHILRFYWDGSEQPSVEVPLGDFFGVGNAMLANVNSWPITVLASGRSRNCWWPMPFSEGCKITVTNESPEPTTAFYYYIDYLELDQGPKTSLRFHAQYRQAIPANFPENYVILEATGEGQYMGCIYSVESTEPQWWGEGDDVIEVDDRQPLWGTGTEDYFCDAWGMREQSTLFHGTPVCEGYNAAGLRSSMYRFHIPDPIPFRKKIRVSIEHGHANDRADNLSSVAFWYQTLPAAPFPPLPLVYERLPGAEGAAFLQSQAWQTALDANLEAKEKLYDLAQRVSSKENQILLEGLKFYVDGRMSLDPAMLEQLTKRYMDLGDYVEKLPEELQYEEPTIDMPTDDDNRVPKTPVVALRVLEKANLDLERRIALDHGFKPGDELIVESTDRFSNTTKEPAYSDSEDFTYSYAKAEVPRLLGMGARFTYGNVEPSWARFTPDFPTGGRYEVFVIFSYGSNAGDTRYEVRSTEGLKTIPVEQRGRPGTPNRNNRQWISLGTYSFDKGQDQDSGSVTLNAAPGVDIPNKDFEYRAYADSVRFVYKGR